MNGLILVIKPPGMTSFDVVAYLRGILKVKKIGHAGTLDPAAGGLLPICLGKATKAIEWFMDFDKSYRAEMVLGVVTDTQDAEGNIIEKNQVTVDINTIKETVNSFVGKYEQTPPMFSAVKINGKRLYDLARQGKEVQRKARQVEIFNIAGVNVKQDYESTIVRFDVDCSKGTYIRTLCHDIGQRIGCGAHMSFLVRTRVGPFSLSDALTLEDIKKHQQQETLLSVMKPVDILFQNYKSMVIGERCLNKFLNGAYITLCDYKLYEINETVRVYSSNGIFLGLGRVLAKDEKKVLKAEKLFISNNSVVS